MKIIDLTFKFLVCFLVGFSVFSQSILISPNNGSKLIESNSTNKAVQLPSVAATSAITSPQKGMVVFDDATGTLSYFNGSIWVPLSNSTTGWAVTGNDLSNTNSGNVGIGTSSPLSLLSLFKTTNPSLQFLNSATGTTVNDGFGVGNSNSDGGKGFLWNYEAAPIGVGTNNIERMSILSNGRVGIGTIAPSSLFHSFIGDAGIVSPRTGTIGTFETNGVLGYVSILSPNNATVGVAFGSPDGSADGSLNYNHATQKMQLNTKASIRMTIDSVGNVGIGDTAPEVKLDVNGAVHIQKDLLLRERLLQPSSSVIYDPFDRQDKSFVTIEPSTNVTSTINGFTVPTTAATFGTLLYLSNGSTGSIVLKNNASTVQNNRIITNTGADVTITGRGGAIFIYDFTGWRLISYAE